MAGTVVALVIVMADQMILRVELPGTAPADVSLQVHQTRLLVTAGVEGAAQLLKHLEGDTHVIYRRDRATGGYFRSVLLPGGVPVDDIKATLTDGVLVVSAPDADGKEPHV
jgi:HSP20 family molecular chaperone IbpA